MKELFDVLTKIRDALGGDKCNVSVLTNEVGGCSIRVYWHGTKAYLFERHYSHGEIKSILDTDIIVDEFI